MNQLAISVENVGIAYRRKTGFFRQEKFWAVNDVSFKVYHGETLGVVGRNGVGKSSLLRVLAGIVNPDKGRVINYGVSASLLSLQVGFVNHLTGRENAILSGMMLGLSKSEVLNRIDDIREYSDIADFFDQPVNSYSSGMRARLGFSVAIYVNPDVILLDEVLGVGDIEFREKSSDTIKSIIKSDKTVVLVSHNGSMMKQLCDRVVWIDDMQTKMEGDPSEVVSCYEKSIKLRRKP
ncbi:ABC transporter ATP-binding protein [bacterium]|nr:ABC transporter ATP-binding protein [bacterium]